VGQAMIPKSRLDALTDGVFAVAMTLLVIDLRVPEGFDPKNAAELLQHLAHLWNQVLLYVVSFYVLSLRWIGMVQINPRGERVGQSFTRWAMVHLLLITFVPFTTMMVGRYISLAPAIWLYAANTILFSLVALRMLALADIGETSAKALEDRIGLLVLIASSLLVIVLSFVDPSWAMLGYLLNLTDVPMRRLLGKRDVTTASG
jgi:uncharacterized membrane protein